MIVAPISDPDLVAMIGRSAGPRTQGVLHLSDIYKRLMMRLQPKRFTGGPMNLQRVELGLLFESMLEEALARKFATTRPGEIVSPEGVYMSPDGVNPDLLAGEEYKATWMTSRHGIVDEYGQLDTKFVHWGIQMMGYAKWLEVDRFILTVLFVNGNYNRSGKLDSGDPDPEAGPTFKRYDLRFTEEEIDQNWTMLMNVAKEEGLL